MIGVSFWRFFSFFQNGLYFLTNIIPQLLAILVEFSVQCILVYHKYHTVWYGTVKNYFREQTDFPRPTVVLKKYPLLSDIYIRLYTIQSN